MFFALQGQPVNFVDPRQWMSRNAITEEPAYLRLFASAKPSHKIRGESSTIYLFVPRAAEAIHRAVPNAKLVAILRQPVERAFSHYVMNRRDRKEPRGEFRDAFQEDDQRTTENWTYGLRYKSLGLYAPQVERYLKMFSRHQLLVFLYEDFLTAPRDMLGKIFDFLDVDTEFKPHLTARRNISGIPRWRWVFNVCRKLSRWNRVVGDYAWVNASITRLDQINLRRISLDPELKHELTLAYYKEDILTLQEMLNRDLSNWLS